MKTLRLLNPCGKGKVKTFSDSAAEVLLKKGMAEHLDEDAKLKFEAAEKEKAEKLAKEKAKQEAAAKKAAEKLTKELAKKEKDAKKKK